MQPGDEELMHKIKGGDMQAFDLLAKRWERRLFNLIHKIIGDVETSKDIRQEVLLRVYQSAKRYRSNSHFKTWLYRVAINSSISELRKLKRRRTLPLAMAYDNGEEQPLENALPDPNPQPDEIMQREEMTKYIQGALQRLPDEQRVVVVLRHYEGLKFQQIAYILNCPLGTVKSRMRHGLERLRTILKDICWEGGTQHGL